jgi:hypothetical protein
MYDKLYSLGDTMGIQKRSRRSSWRAPMPISLRAITTYRSRGIFEGGAMIVAAGPLRWVADRPICLAPVGGV